MKVCPYCQNEVTEETIACSKCGRAIINPNDFDIHEKRRMNVLDEYSEPATIDPYLIDTSKVAFVLSILAVILFGILTCNGGLLTDDLRAPLFSQAGFWALFYGIPLISFLSLGIALKGIFEKRVTSRVAFLTFCINILVLFIMGFWHFLALGLSGYFYVCISDIAAFLILIVFVVLMLRKRSPNS